MKKQIFAFILFAMLMGFVETNAQVNMNPNPNGEP
jgi:hypothetical protein